MLNDIRWKFVAVTAILAMAVSLLSGGLSGIGFGTLIMRALIGGILFAGLAAGLNLLIARLFPEILDLYSDTESTGPIDGDDPESTGTRVDIELPAENPVIPGADEDDRTSFQQPVPEGSKPTESAEAGDDEGVAAAEPVGDLDRFSGDFSDVDEEGSSRSSKGDGVMGDHDPEEIAQAIHTVISRDEKG